MALSSSASVLISRAVAARRVVVGSPGWEYGDDGYGQNAPPRPGTKGQHFRSNVLIYGWSLDHVNPYVKLTLTLTLRPLT